jgi:hypothetical protein
VAVPVLERAAFVRVEFDVGGAEQVVELVEGAPGRPGCPRP